jgi:hypothetical protein
MKLIDYYSESFSSASSSLKIAVSTIIIKIGLVLGFDLVSGRMYSIVLNSGISSAGRVCSDILEA